MLTTDNHDTAVNYLKGFRHHLIGKDGTIAKNSGYSFDFKRFRVTGISVSKVFRKNQHISCYPEVSKKTSMENSTNIAPASF